MGPVNVRIRFAVIVSSLVIAGLTIPAQADDQFASASRAGRQYVALHAGGPLPSSVDATINNSLGVSESGRVILESGSGGALAVIVGQYLTDRVSIEGFFTYGYFGDWEMNFRQGFAGNPNAGRRQNASGNVQVLGLSLDLQYDLDPIAERLRPFVGAGAGVNVIFQNDVGLDGGSFPTNDTDIAFTGCLMAGVHYAISNDVDLTFKYAGVFTSRTRFRDSAGATSYSASSPARFDNTITVGARYFLN